MVVSGIVFTAPFSKVATVTTCAIPSNIVVCGVVDLIIFILLLVDGANLGRPPIKVNIFFQLFSFSLIPSGFQGAVFPCKNVKNQSELQFNARFLPQSCGCEA